MNPGHRLPSPKGGFSGSSSPRVIPRGPVSRQAVALRHVANIPIRKDIIIFLASKQSRQGGPDQLQARILHQRVSGVKGHPWNPWALTGGSVEPVGVPWNPRALTGGSVEPTGPYRGFRGTHGPLPGVPGPYRGFLGWAIESG